METMNCPASVKNAIAKKKLKFYNIDAIKLAIRTSASAERINMVMQAAFFKVADIIPVEDAFKYMKEAVKKTYGKKGDKIVNMNNGRRSTRRLPSWCRSIIRHPGRIQTKARRRSRFPPAITFDNFVLPSLKFKGDDLPVSAFDPRGYRAHRHIAV